MIAGPFPTPRVTETSYQNMDAIPRPPPLHPLTGHTITERGRGRGGVQAGIPVLHVGAEAAQPSIEGRHLLRAAKGWDGRRWERHVEG